MPKRELKPWQDIDEEDLSEDEDMVDTDEDDMDFENSDVLLSELKECLECVEIVVDLLKQRLDALTSSQKSQLWSLKESMQKLLSQ